MCGAAIREKRISTRRYERVNGTASTQPTAETVDRKFTTLASIKSSMTIRKGERQQNRTGYTAA